jgi:glycosyltransferase involved in cell wall biosynthesis
MRELFLLADALFFPSRQEGFGIPVLEAAFHRLPVFCSDIEPLNALLEHGVTTFALGASPEEIAALILQTLGSDAAFAARKQTLRTYSWDRIYRNFLSPLLAETETS